MSMIVIASIGVTLGIGLIAFLNTPRGDKSGFKANDKLNPYNRKSFSGEPNQVRLSRGVTQYYLSGPEDGTKVVLVHGITVPAVVYREIAENLAKKGYRVLCYDLYGRGYSNGPDCEYNASVYVGQLYDLVEKLEWKKFNLVGFSLGGAISTAFTSSYPHMVNHLSLIAPAGLFDRLPFFARLVTLPILGEVIAYTIGKKLIMMSSTTSFKDSSKQFAQELISIRNYQILNHPGYLRAYFSTLKNFPVSGLEKSYKSLQDNPQIPLLVLWGDQDKVVPYKLSQKMMKIVPRANLVTISGGDHHCLNEETQFVTDNLLQHFEK